MENSNNKRAVFVQMCRMLRMNEMILAGAATKPCDLHSTQVQFVVQFHKTVVQFPNNVVHFPTKVYYEYSFIGKCTIKCTSDTVLHYAVVQFCKIIPCLCSDVPKHVLPRYTL